MRLTRFGGFLTVGLVQLTQRARKIRYAIQVHLKLHLNAHNLWPVPYDFGFPYLQNRHIQYEMKVERLGIMCYSYDLVPGAWFG